MARTKINLEFIVYVRLSAFAFIRKLVRVPPVPHEKEEVLEGFVVARFKAKAAVTCELQTKMSTVIVRILRITRISILFRGIPDVGWYVLSTFWITLASLPVANN